MSPGEGEKESLSRRFLSSKFTFYKDLKVIGLKSGSNLTSEAQKLSLNPTKYKK